MKKIPILFATVCLSVGTLTAKEVRSAGVIFEQKCQMCHMAKLPKTPEEKKRVVSPPMPIVMKNVVMGIDAELDDGTPEGEIRKLAIPFMKDYLFYPDRSKTNCEDISFDRFGVMPSLKGFISEEELDVVIPWVYDTFKPIKIDGKWTEKR